MAELASTLPGQLTRGDSLRVRLEFAGYSALEGWTLELALVGPGKVAADVEADGAGFLVTITAEDSATELEAGIYTWAARVTGGEGGAEAVTVARGQLEVLPDPLELEAPSEERSFARRALEQLEAAILAKPGAATSYALFGRTYTFATHEELLRAREFLRREVAREEEAARIARGEPSRRTAWVRFGRVV